MQHWTQEEAGESSQNKSYEREREREWTWKVVFWGQTTNHDVSFTEKEKEQPHSLSENDENLVESRRLVVSIEE